MARNPRIPESFIEHRQLFAAPWIAQWAPPNPFISIIHEALRDYGVGLADFSFAKDITNIAETSLNVIIRGINASITLGLDSLVFSAANPDWSDASRFSNIFERVAKAVARTAGTVPFSQETTLALHVVDESADLKALSAKLVNTSILGDATFYGISIFRETGPLLIEKSLKYDNGVFFRIQHKFGGTEAFAAIAAALYREEVYSLGLLGFVDPNEAKLP